MDPIVNSMTTYLAQIMQKQPISNILPMKLLTELESFLEEFTALEVAEYIIDSIIKCLNQMFFINEIKGFTISIITRQGGVDAQDLSAKLFIMYMNFLNLYKIQYEVLDIKYAETGIHQASVNVNAPFYFPLFAYETGIHRIERYSPFKKQKKIYTSSIEIQIEPVLKPSSIEINQKELSIKPIKASGPGGQFVNKTLSGALLKYRNYIIRVTSSRSFIQNKNKALELLKSKLNMERQIAARTQAKQFLNSYVTKNIIRTYDLIYNYVQYTPLKIKIKNADDILKGNLIPILMYNTIYAARKTCN